MKTAVDYIIVGQGLAGSTLALQLLKRKKRILVYDLPQKNISSRVAAGLFNPITGKNWVKTWKADLLFPFMKKFFQDVERQLNTRLYFEKTTFRPFQSLPNQNDWMGKWATPGYSEYVASTHVAPIDKDIIKNPFGGLELNSTGYIDINAFLDIVRDLLISRNALKVSHFDQDKIQHSGRPVYEDVEAGKIIFCQGVSNSKSLWSYLPFMPVKGEILSINSSVSLDKIYNMGTFILPRHDGITKMGSTYEHNYHDENPTESGKNQILSQAERFFLPKFEVVGHDAGVRPATLDRRPFIGMHREKQNIVIFNGLGAKGVTLAPYFSEVLVDYLESGRELEKEVNVERFRK